MKDIDDPATVNRVMFYAHFDDKFALLEDTMRALFQERPRHAAGKSRLTPDNLARLMALVGSTVVEFAGHCPPPRGQLDTLMVKQVKGAVCEVLRGWLAATSNSRAGPGSPLILASLPMSLA